MIRLLLLTAFITFLAASAHANCAQPNEGLIGHWKLDEASGNPDDSSGNGHHGTNFGNPVWQPSGGQIDGALHFDGTDDRVDVPYDPAFDITGDITIAAWINKDDLNDYGGILAKTNGGDTFDYVLYVCGGGSSCYPANTDRLVFESDALGRLYGTAAISTGWHHVAFTRSGSTWKMYIDGTQDASGTNGSAFGANTVPIRIGTDGPDWSAVSFFDGKLDDVRIYNRALSADEIAALYSVSSTADADPGVMVYDTRHARMMYCNGTNWVHAGTGAYNPNAVSFANLTDLNMAPSLNGVADGTKASGSLWFRKNVADLPGAGAEYGILHTTGGRFRITIIGNGEQFHLQASDSTPTANLVGWSNALPLDTNWHHLLFSYDLSDASKRHIYIDGANAANSWPTYNTASTIDFTTTNIAIGNYTGGTADFNGDLADMWIDTGTYIDLSQEVNRRKFRSSTGMPMYLGEDGSLPTGGKPDIFLTGSTDDWHTNKGAGGGFTENGALTTATSQPADSLTGSTGADAYCWGSDGVSQLGAGAGDQGPLTQPSGSVIVAGGHKWAQLGGGGNQSHCAIDEDGDAYCWGRGLEGQIGNGASSTQPSPTLVSGGHKWKMISNGWNTTCGITTAGAAYCWGSDTAGQLGNGASGASNSPSLVSGGFTWDYIEAGDEHTCAIRDNGAAYCWGQNNGGQLGCGGACGGSANSPQLVLGSPTGTAWTQIGGGWQFSCGLRDDDTAWCWGTETDGELGNGGAGNNNSTTPVAVAGGHTFVRLSVGGDIACGVKADGSAYCWGRDDAGEQGNGAGVTDNVSPGLVQGGHTWRKVEAADGFTCGITTAGDAWCWGDDSWGRLGNGGTTGNQHTPTLVQGGFKWSDIGPMHVFDGSATCGIVENCTGQIKYNSDFNVMQYCIGPAWVPMGPVGGAPPADNLLGHWQLDETSGAADDSAGSSDLTLGNTPTWQPSGGLIKGALSFDSASNEHATNTAIPYTPGNTLSISMWIKPNGLPAVQSVPYLHCLDSAASFLIYDDGGWSAQAYRSGDASWPSYIVYGSGAPFSSGQWTHVVLTANGTTTKIYANGAFDNQRVTADAPLDCAGSDVRIGRYWDTSASFNGAIDDVRIYDDVLTDAEIQQIYAHGIGGGKTIGGSGTCASPSMPEGSMVYNTDHSVMQYCNGEKWIGIGWAP